MRSATWVSYQDYTEQIKTRKAKRNTQRRGPKRRLGNRCYASISLPQVVVVVVMSKWVYENMPVMIYLCPQKTAASSERHWVPRDRTRPRQVPPTQQPSRPPAKERASRPNSASDDFSKLPSRRRHVIATFASAEERSILDKQSFASNPRLCFFASFLFPAVREFKSPCLCFFLLCFFLLYCCTAVVLLVVHTWGVRGWSVNGFFCCVLCFTAVQRTAALL